jgi:hypothetical protein
VVDSEWTENYVSPNELENLLKFSERCGFDLQTIVTVSARHACSLERTTRLAEVMARHENANLNLVAGNRTYLTEEEMMRPAAKELVRLARSARKILPDRTILIGTERLTKATLQISKEYGLIPFLLLDRALEIKIAQIQEENGNGGVALYVPYFATFGQTSIATEIVRRFWRYALRRRWVREAALERGYDPCLLETYLQTELSDCSKPLDNDVTELLTGAIGKLSVCGEAGDFMRAFEDFRRLDIDTVIGLPANEEEDQVAAFSHYLRQFRQRSD